MMKIVGIIAEYNPFHNGHLYHIEETKKQTYCDAIIAVMSGNFSQRGEATITDKFTRTKMALLNGVDLVLELPAPLATASAERFANGGVSILNQCQIVSTLSFGSECGSLKTLQGIAQKIVENESLLYKAIQMNVQNGISFPKARQLCITSLLQNDNSSDILNNPNNILGIEYLKALRKSNSTILSCTVKRSGAHYHEDTLTTSVASATAIRKAIYNEIAYQKHMPDSATKLMETSLPDMEKISPFLHYQFLFSEAEALYQVWDVPQDLIRTFIKTSQLYPDYRSFVEKATSKTYTRATVQRSLLRLLLNIQTKDMLSLESPYIRVLGCRKEKTWLLKLLSQNAKVPILTNLSRQYTSLSSIQKIWIDYEIKATKLYAYLTSTPTLATSDFTQPFILL